jgi:hypothetical protein
VLLGKVTAFPRSSPETLVMVLINGIGKVYSGMEQILEHDGYSVFL